MHGTFVDKVGGLGVLSGDMTVLRFEVRNGAVTAIGEIVGALADSAGNVLGAVNQELALPVDNLSSTCNQLRMELAATDGMCCRRPCTSTRKSRGSTRGTARPRKRSACSARRERSCGGNPTLDSLVRALNDVTEAMAAKPVRLRDAGRT